MTNLRADSYTIELLERVGEFLDGQSDIRDGSDGAPLPNDAMSLQMAVEQHITTLKRQSSGPNDERLRAVLEGLECQEIDKLIHMPPDVLRAVAVEISTAAKYGATLYKLEREALSPATIDGGKT